MTAYDYRRPRATATRLIARFGTTARLQRSVPSDGGGTGLPYDPTADVSTPRVTSYAVSVVITDYTLRERASGLVNVKARKALMSVAGLPAEFALDDTWQLVVGATTYSVCDPVTTYAPGNVVLAYEFPVQA